MKLTLGITGEDHCDARRREKISAFLGIADFISAGQEYRELSS
jgi:hypothetical protein